MSLEIGGDRYMVCKNCGQEIPSSQANCPNCGKINNDVANTLYDPHNLLAPNKPIDTLGENLTLPKEEDTDKKIPSEKKKYWKILVGVLLILILAVAGYFLFTKVLKSNSNSEEHIVKSSTELVSYNGVYTMGDTSVIIYMDYEDSSTLIIKQDSESSSMTVVLDEEGNLVRENATVAEEIRVSIEKTDEGIKLTASSSDKDSILNKISGNYVKNEFTSLEWDGAYTKGDVAIILSECDEKLIYANITQKDNNMISTKELELTTYTDSKITYVGTFFDDEETVTIEKTEEGIKVTASSTDTDSILNKISGTYVVSK